MTERDEPRTESEAHPEALLAGYVDGDLSPGQASLVDRHLSSCATCREEVDAARRARRAMKALPALHVPAGLTRSVVSRARRPRALSPALLWGTAGAAAAVAAGLILFAVFHEGAGGGQEAAMSRAGGAAAPVPSSTVRIRVSHTNYDPAKIQSLASSLASRPSRDLLSGANAAPSLQPKTAGAPAAFAPISFLACLRQAGAPVGRDTLIQLVEARFHGTPAYIAAFTHRPGSGKRPDLLEIWVAARSGCALLHYAAQPLGR
jgi:hypothetical protein